MPSSSPTHNRSLPGKLYVVATPIGHPDDITIRALSILSQVDLIAAEDTRQTARLLKHHNIHASIVSYHEHNEERRAEELLDKLENGQMIALVSDAGTPTVSDPGYRLVNAARRAGIDVVPVPGATAAMAALSVAGMPTDAFVFIGFPLKKKAKRLRQLEILAADPRTLVFYESPKRIVSFLEELLSAFGDRVCLLAREMTKLHEEYIKGPVSFLWENLKARPAIKGEVTLLVAGCPSEEDVSAEDISDAVRRELAKADCRPSQVARIVSKRFNISKNRAYEAVLKAGKKADAESDEPS